jgi:hypothetical protein
VSWKAVDDLKQQIPLLEYLQAQDWKPARRIAGGRVMGYARCMPITSRVSWWIQTKTYSTAMVADAVGT